MKLLYALTSYPPSTGGAQLHQHMLAQEMMKNHQVQVVSLWDQNRTDWLLGTTLRMPNHSKDYNIDDVPVRRVGLSPLEKLVTAPLLPFYYPLMDIALPPIAAILQRHLDGFAAKADLIHNVRIGREPISFAALQAARKYDIPFVLTPVHHPRWVGWRYRAHNELYRNADAVLALTHAEKRTLIEIGVREDRITVIGHGPILAATASPELFLQKHNIDGPLVLFVGQHYEYKGFKQLLDAAPLVWSKIPETHFIFIGPVVGNSEEYFTRLIDRRIHRLGNVSLQEKTDALAACDVFCLPSTQESFGGVYTEAWNFRKPVIGCNIPAVSEVIRDEIDGLLINQNPAEIAEALCTLLLTPALAQRMGVAGYNQITMLYSWTIIASKVEHAYQKALKSS